jgi:hypothetical protein
MVEGAVNVHRAVVSGRLPNACNVPVNVDAAIDCPVGNATVKLICLLAPGAISDKVPEFPPGKLAPVSPVTDKLANRFTTGFAPVFVTLNTSVATLLAFVLLTATRDTVVCGAIGTCTVVFAAA